MNRRRVLQGAAVTVAIAGAGGLAATWAGMRSSAQYDAYIALLRRQLDTDGGIPELIRMATLAPNGHNTQSWKFRSTGRSIVLSPDFSRRTPVVDPDDHHIFVSLGAAAENLAIAGRAAGLQGDPTVTDAGSVRFDWQPGKKADEPLTQAIVARQSTRSVYDGHPLDAPTLQALEAAARSEGVRMVLITERAKLNAVRDLVIAGNDRQMSDPAFVAELKSWLRFSARSAMQHGDGLYSAASGNPALPDFLGRPAFDLVFKKGPENEKYATQMNSSAGVAVFFGDHANPQNWVKVGRAMERFLLAATLRNVRCAFVNQPVEVARLRPALVSLVGEKDVRPDLVIRFGRAPLLPYSPRRAVADVS